VDESPDSLAHNHQTSLPDPRFIHLRRTLDALRQGADGEFRRGCRAIDIDPDQISLPPGDVRQAALKSLIAARDAVYARAAREYVDDADKILDRALREEQHSELIKALQASLTPAETKSEEGVATGPALDQHTARVLCYLALKHPVLCTLDNIESGADLSRATAHKAVTYLIEIGYALRPSGSRKGCTLSEHGRAVAALLII
jgi:hypothetical protein